MNTKKVWFVTGASKGLGLTLTRKLLAQGFRVAATSRSKKSLIEEIGEENENFLPIEMDLTNNQNVKEGINATILYGTHDRVRSGSKLAESQGELDCPATDVPDRGGQGRGSLPASTAKCARRSDESHRTTRAGRGLAMCAYGGCWNCCCCCCCCCAGGGCWKA